MSDHETQRHGDHDGAYKNLFSHREAVEDLLRGYVATTWLQLIDLSTLERAPAEHVGDLLTQRKNDIIWRVRWKREGPEDWLFIYLLMEFQSTVDATMPLRLAEYITLLYQGLIKARAVPQGPHLALPPVVPIVLYNGRERWWAKRQLADLIASPVELAEVQLRVAYVLIDEARMDTALAADRNLVAMLFQLEQSRTPADIQAVTQALADTLRSPQQSSLRDAIVALLKESLRSRLPGLQLPANLPLEEVPKMLGENIADWAAAQVAEGVALGQALGEARGEARGEAHGLITMVRSLVSDGILTVDQGRAKIRALMAAKEIPEAAGRSALDQLG